MLATIREKSRHVLNMQHITPNSKDEAIQSWALEQGISIEETSYMPINALLRQLMIAERLCQSMNPGRWNAEIY